MAPTVDPKLFPLKVVCDNWLALIERAKKVKHEEFGQWANEAANFFDGPWDWMWREENLGGASGPLAGGGTTWKPNFKMSVNRLFEAVALFGPVLYFQNPVVDVTVNPLPSLTPIGLQIAAGADPQAMMMQLQESEQMEMLRQDEVAVHTHYLNWLQQEGEKKASARKVIQEAIVTGLGLMETTIEQPPGSTVKIPRSQYRSVWDLQIDPDAKKWADVTWIALRSVLPKNQVALKWGVPEESLKGHFPSDAARATGKKTGTRHGDNAEVGITHDLVEVWEVYSKNGAGQRIKKQTRQDNGAQAPEIPEWLDECGDFCYLAIAKGVPFPLNASPDVTQLVDAGQIEAIQDALMWPYPAWQDSNSDGGWPISRLFFYEKSGCAWPVSLCKAAVPEMRFLNWMMSFLADKTAAQCHTLVGIQKSAADNLRKQLINREGPFTVLEIEQVSGQKIEELISFLNSPNSPSDVWQMLMNIHDRIDKVLGLTELMYGISSRQMRSAQESRDKYGALQVRPDDMANQVEDWLSVVATRECQAMLYACQYEDVLPVLGPVGATFFATYIQTRPFEDTIRDYAFKIRAGTARKPNREAKVAQLTEFGQYFLPVAQQFMAMGVMQPINAYLRDVATAMDLDGERYVIPEDAMQPPQGPDPAAEAQADQDAKMMLESHKAGLEDQQADKQLKRDMELERLKAKLRPKPRPVGAGK